MVRTFALRGPQLWLLLLIGLFLLLTAFPLFLIFGAILAVAQILRSIFVSKKKHFQEHYDPNLSSVIKNEKIGPYRVRKSSTDPDVIEVVDNPEKE